MTIFVNVSDAIGTAGNHGITRVERKLSLALLERSDVELVVIHEGLLWSIDKSAVTRRVHRPSPSAEPQVERFGVDRPTRTSRARTLRSLRSTSVGSGASPLTSIKPTDGDVFFSAGVDWSRGLMDAAERLVYGAGTSYIGFCYDLIPIDHPEWIFPPQPERFKRHFERMARIASSILCISNSTRADFMRHFPHFEASRLELLILGADAAVEIEREHAVFANSIFPDEPYAVYCATLDRRKNHQILYRAMREMVRRKVRGNLVFVGMPGSGVEDLIDAMRNDPLVRGRIAHVSNCDDRHLAAVYQRASFAVYPSLYEGWGLGVTEALANGKRSIVASGSSLEEASFGTSHAVHPLATKQWVDAMSTWFAGSREAPAVRLPTWRDTAEQLMRVVAR